MCCRDLASNNMSGVLTDTWAAPDALPALRLLSLAGNSLSGTLPLVRNHRFFFFFSDTAIYSR